MDRGGLRVFAWTNELVLEELVCGVLSAYVGSYTACREIYVGGYRAVS